jgi:two-component system KDP operon response regulator KdpE
MTAIPTRVLVVEDEPQMRRFLRTTLTANGYQVLEAGSGEEALTLASSWNPEMVLLDLGLPDVDGLEVTRRLREWSAVPLVVVSARGQEVDKVRALDGGADDYLTKPFGAGELLARMRAALRHASRLADDPGEPVVTVGELEVDLRRRRVFLADEEVRLTPLEYKLLATLAKSAGRVLTHRHLLKEVWGPNSVEQSHYLRVYMAQLRRKIENDPARPRWLLTEPGVGYRFADS